MNSLDSAVSQAKRFISDEGADIIDIGGESTRPDSQPVSVREEISRVVPVIEALSLEISVPISIDTYKSAVAGRAVEAGASMINDVWGLQKSPELATIAAEARIPIIITSNQRDNPCKDIMSAVISDLWDKIGMAEDGGVMPENIIIDPGVGFGKTWSKIWKSSGGLPNLNRSGSRFYWALRASRLSVECWDYRQVSVWKERRQRWLSALPTAPIL